MSPTYIDTSVLGPYYCPESLSATADAAITAIDSPVISALTEVEFTSLISRKRRAGDFTGAKAARISALFDEHLASGRYRIAPVATEHYIEARTMVRDARHALRTLDALHLAIARSQGCELLTADRVMAKSAREFGIRSTLLG